MDMFGTYSIELRGEHLQGHSCNPLSLAASVSVGGQRGLSRFHAPEHTQSSHNNSNLKSPEPSICKRRRINSFYVSYEC